MVAVRFIAAAGGERILDIVEGISAMEGAVKGGVDGIDADCGGAVSCATCHVHVAADWLDRLPPPTAEECEMLDFAIERGSDSRLSCQIVLTPDLDGLTLHIPATQR